jgi:hypothetical protein
MRTFYDVTELSTALKPALLAHLRMDRIFKPTNFSNNRSHSAGPGEMSNFF